MIPRIRLATPEESKTLEDRGDIQGCTVLALDTPEGVALAVVRTALEVDPMVFPEGMSNRLKTVFIRDVETVLAAQGARQYYFNVHATNEPMLNFSKHYGAVPTSTEPEIRFKKAL